MPLVRRAFRYHTAPPSRILVHSFIRLDFRFFNWVFCDYIISLSARLSLLGSFLHWFPTRRELLQVMAAAVDTPMADHAPAATTGTATATAPKPKQQQQQQPNPQIQPCRYKTGRTLGAGSYSVVKECVHTETGRYYAAKVINKRLMAGREHMVR